MEFGLVLFFLLVTAALLAVAAKTIRIVPQATVMMVERLGRFHKLADSGLHILVPFVDKPRGVSWTGIAPDSSSIDLREQFLDMPLQAAITRDNVQIVIDAVVYWQITDPIKSVYEVLDLIGGIMQLTVTGMRSVIGEMELDQCLSSREEINAKLRILVDEATDKWGVKVLRIDVKNINPPHGVRVTMEKQMTAERNRRALVLQAEGERQAAITRAEGERQAAITNAEGGKTEAILRAEGAAQARLLAARAEAEAIARITEGMAQALPRDPLQSYTTTSDSPTTADLNNPAHYLITARYIESLKEMAKSQNAKVVYMPSQSSRVLASVGAIREIFSRTGVGS